MGRRLQVHTRGPSQTRAGYCQVSGLCAISSAAAQKLFVHLRTHWVVLFVYRSLARPPKARCDSAKEKEKEKVIFERRGQIIRKIIVNFLKFLEAF
ncbi:hypothetical protein HYPSUDRAFT_33669, partial [Hypholoma sublateritium FD-334 SS-4]